MPAMNVPAKAELRASSQRMMATASSTPKRSYRTLAARREKSACKWAGNFTSRFRGVHFSKQLGKWIGKIYHNREARYLGIFATEEAAAEAYDLKGLVLKGNRARLNFPARRAEYEVKAKHLRTEEVRREQNKHSQTRVQQWKAHRPQHEAHQWQRRHQPNRHQWHHPQHSAPLQFPSASMALMPSMALDCSLQAAAQLPFRTKISKGITFKKSASTGCSFILI